MLGLLDSEKKTLRICVTVETQYRCVTDRKTDGRDILPRHSPRYGYVLRGNNVRLNCTECSDRFKVRFVVRLQLLLSIHCLLSLNDLLRRQQCSAWWRPERPREDFGSWGTASPAKKVPIRYWYRYIDIGDLSTIFLIYRPTSNRYHTI